MRSPALRSILVGLALLALQPGAYAANAGTIESVAGNVSIVGADSKSRAAAAKGTLQAGDLVVTDARSEALIKLGDDSKLVLRQNTRFRFDEYRYEKAASDSLLVSVLRGAMRMITGTIGRANPSQVRVNASTATIGIRGTDFEVAVIPEDTAEARAGVYDYVRDGATDIRIASGQSLEVRKEQTAFAPDKPKPGEEPLQLLGATPQFLQQGGGLDTLIQSLTTTPINIIHHLPPMIR
jgi:hypothetical protein